MAWIGRGKNKIECKHKKIIEKGQYFLVYYIGVNFSGFVASDAW